MSQHTRIARQLMDASAHNKPVNPFGKIKHLTLADAYAIQNLLTAYKIEAGDTPIGKKVAFANTASQKAQGLNEPAFATMFASGFMDSAKPLSLATLPNAAIEAEITFLLKDDLHGPGITAAHVIQATEAVYASFEIISHQFDGETCGYDKIASNICFGGLVLGSQGISPRSLNLRTLGIVLEKNGQVIDTATGAAVLDNPAKSVAWLANALAQHGRNLQKGDLILSGSATTPHPIAAGDVFYAHFEHLGSVSVTFTE